MLVWSNHYHPRKWTRQPEFKPWMRLFVIHIAVVPKGKL